MIARREHTVFIESLSYGFFLASANRGRYGMLVV